jgi:hypothetical protein
VSLSDPWADTDVSLFACYYVSESRTRLMELDKIAFEGDAGEPQGNLKGCFKQLYLLKQRNRSVQRFLMCLKSFKLKTQEISKSCYRLVAGPTLQYVAQFIYCVVC